MMKKESKNLGQGIACEECGAMLMRDAQFEGEGAFNIRCAKCLSLWRAKITKRTIITLAKIALGMAMFWATTYYLTGHPEIITQILDNQQIDSIISP